MVSIVVQNLVEIDAGISITWNFQYFARLAWKRLFMPQKLGFSGDFTPKMGSNVNETPKRHICGSKRFYRCINYVSICNSSWEIAWKVWHFFGLFWHLCKKAVTWLYATLLMSICSFCRGQHADANIWSILLFFRFFLGLPKSALIAILKTPSGSISFYRAMLCIRGTSHGPVSVCVCHKSEFY